MAERARRDRTRQRLTDPPVDWGHLAGVTLQGTDHLARGVEAQDAFLARRGADGTIALAVADGAGSRDRSALGAHLAVDIAVRMLLARRPDEDTQTRWQACMEGTASDLIAEFRRLADRIAGGDSSELACTLVAAVIRPPWCGLVCIGDAFAAVLRRQPDGSELAHLVVPPELEGEGITVFLTSDRARERIRTDVLWDLALSGVVLGSDGIVPLALERPAAQGIDPELAEMLPVQGFFTGLAQDVRATAGEQVRALLLTPDARRSTDDLTVLFALDGD